MHLGAIVNGEDMQEIAHIPNATFTDSGWMTWLSDTRITYTHMDNGWSRLHSSCANGGFERALWLDTGSPWSCWLSQANYIFNQILTPPKCEDCCLITGITYHLTLSSPPETLPEGYLFFCPLEDLREENGRWLPNPECLAYWSFDDSGSEMLSPEEASRLGFPSLDFKMKVCMRSCNQTVYAVLSQFHAGKGFDPNSQDLARHLGHPLYELSSALTNGSARTSESDSSEHRDNPVSTHDAPHPQWFRFLLCDILGLILALMYATSLQMVHLDS
ncbi:hypothetical protein C8R44DRAFT_689041 [Mycena epipterygia]|nr:hypothetical protein C8R44DRAFT_689041 [Mycena epipterygia]